MTARAWRWSRRRSWARRAHALGRLAAHGMRVRGQRPRHRRRRSRCRRRPRRTWSSPRSRQAGGVAIADTTDVASLAGGAAAIGAALDAFGRVDVVGEQRRVRRWWWDARRAGRRGARRPVRGALQGDGRDHERGVPGDACPGATGASSTPSRRSRSTLGSTEASATARRRPRCGRRRCTRPDAGADAGITVNAISPGAPHPHERTRPRRRVPRRGVGRARPARRSTWRGSSPTWRRRTAGDITGRIIHAGRRGGAGVHDHPHRPLRSGGTARADPRLTDCGQVADGRSCRRVSGLGTRACAWRGRRRVPRRRRRWRTARRRSRARGRWRR